MANNNSGIAVLKEAFEKGYQSFNTVEKNAAGNMNNPPNPYMKGSLPFKEFERGYGRGYWEAKKRMDVC